MGLDTFVGRERESTELAELVASQRVVTLVGPGGIGKTRLATEVSASLATSFDGGVLVAELSGTSDADNIESVVARQLGFDSLRALQFRSAGSTTLVVLDNCESALDQAADVARQLVEGDGRVHVLATSRAPLRLRGERLVALDPLEVPTLDDPAIVCESAAARLFLELAQAAGATWERTPEHLAAVGRLMRQLDGLPLAIELAAARSRVLTPPEIVKLLDRQLDLLSRPGAETDRHHSLRTAIRSSYEPLTAQQQRFFRQLAVLSAPFDLTLAHALTGQPGLEIDTLDRLMELVDLSLVAVRTGNSGQTLFRLYDSIRAFGLEQMEACQETAEVNERYVDAMADVADAMVAEALEAFTPEVLARIRDQFVHLANAIEWCLSHDSSPARAYRLFIPFYGPTGARTEVARLAKRVQATWSTPAPLEAEALAVMASVTFLSGDTKTGVAMAKEAIAHPAATTLAKMVSHRAIGFAAIHEDRTDVAQAELQLAIDYALPFSETFARELQISRMASIRAASERPAAVDALNEIVAAAARNHEKINVMWASVILAVHHTYLDDLLAARRSVDAALTVANDTGYPWSIGAAHRAVASVRALQEGWDAAAPHFREALELTVRVGDIEGTAVYLRTAAGAASYLGDRRRAERLWAIAPPVRGTTIAQSMFEAEERALIDELGPAAPVDFASSISVARELLCPGTAMDAPVAFVSPAAATPNAAATIRFGEYELDEAMHELRKSGERIHIEPQVYDVLVYLIHNRGKVVTKNELLDNVWGNRFVSESALSSRIKSARKATGDDGRTQGVIRTVHAKGFSFVAPVEP